MDMTFDQLVKSGYLCLELNDRQTWPPLKGQNVTPAKIAYNTKCGYCGMPMATKKHGEKGALAKGMKVYCSTICRRKAKNEQIYSLYQRYCVICGKPYRSPREDSKYCSRSCFVADRQPKARECERCGALHRRRNSRYCSRECATPDPPDKDWDNVPLVVPRHMDLFKNVLPCPFCQWIGESLVHHARKVHKIKNSKLRKMLGINKTAKLNHAVLHEALSKHIPPMSSNSSFREEASQEWERRQDLIRRINSVNERKEKKE